MNEDLTILIIKVLGKHRDRNVITRKVCEQGGLNWKEAEQLIVLVEAKHRRTITTRQTPLILFLSIGTLLLGLGLLTFNMQIVFAFFQNDVFGQIFSLPGSHYRILGVSTGLVSLRKAVGAIFPE
jgi:hypothetical protein